MYHLLYRRKELTPEQEGELCIKCQACCRFMVSLRQDHPQRVEFLEAWGIMFITDGKSMATFTPHACQHISEDGCKIYNDRPVVCKNFKAGDDVPMWRPFCFLWELKPEDERAEIMKNWSPTTNGRIDGGVNGNS